MVTAQFQALAGSIVRFGAQKGGQGIWHVVPETGFVALKHGIRLWGIRRRSGGNREILVLPEDATLALGGRESGQINPQGQDDLPPALVLHEAVAEELLPKMPPAPRPQFIHSFRRNFGSTKRFKDDGRPFHRQQPQNWTHLAMDSPRGATHIRMERGVREVSLETACGTLGRNYGFLNYQAPANYKLFIQLLSPGRESAAEPHSNSSFRSSVHVFTPSHPRFGFGRGGAG